MRPVLLAMNPGNDPGDAVDPYGPSGKRLIELIGRDAFDKFDRTNMLDRKVWSRWRARKRATEMKESMKGRTVVVLGQETWMVLALPMCNKFSCINYMGATWYRAPHPSGRNRMFNEEKYRNKMRDMFKNIVEKFR